MEEQRGPRLVRHRLRRVRGMRDGTAGKDVNFQVGDKHLRMPKEGKFRVAELLTKAVVLDIRGTGKLEMEIPVDEKEFDIVIAETCRD
ncbi:hypothetical protein BTVI_82487 [Pitangus sulphuratus]|nr:hypothetical protein BTVI_82487 [Pitangus sulphuratus]